MDGTLIPSFSFHDTTGYSGKHHQTGTKVAIITDKEGLPLSLTLAPGNRHDYPLAVVVLARLRVGRRTRPAILLGDRGFDGRDLRRSLRQRGIKTNIPERRFQRRRKRGRSPHYDPELGKQRYVVERTNAWLKSYRRLHFRFDYTAASFRAFLLLACIVTGVKRLVV